MVSNCILVLDDDPSILEFIRQILTDEGYEVCTGSNGLEGLEILANRAVSLVILDLMMPVMDGWKFAESWHSLPTAGRPPVIVLSADRDAEQKARNLGLATGLAKPFMLDTFLDTVANYVHN